MTADDLPDMSDATVDALLEDLAILGVAALVLRPVPDLGWTAGALCADGEVHAVAGGATPSDAVSLAHERWVEWLDDGGEESDDAVVLDEDEG